MPAPKWRVSHIIPHLCGLPSRKRYSRRLVMFRCPVDDSGNNTNRPVLVMGGCVGRVDEFNKFADAWDIALNESPAIDYNKHSEARSLEGCFKGFSGSDATAKTLKMASVIAGHELTIFAAHTRRVWYDRLVSEHALK